MAARDGARFAGDESIYAHDFPRFFEAAEAVEQIVKLGM
jgi:hypothetical protein